MVRCYWRALTQPQGDQYLSLATRWKREKLLCAKPIYVASFFFVGKGSSRTLVHVREGGKCQWGIAIINKPIDIWYWRRLGCAIWGDPRHVYRGPEIQSRWKIVDSNLKYFLKRKNLRNTLKRMCWQIRGQEVVFVQTKCSLSGWLLHSSPMYIQPEACVYQLGSEPITSTSSRRITVSVQLN